MEMIWAPEPSAARRCSGVEEPSPSARVRTMSPAATSGTLVWRGLAWATGEQGATRESSVTANVEWVDLRVGVDDKHDLPPGLAGVTGREGPPIQ